VFEERAAFTLRVKKVVVLVQGVGEPGPGLSKENSVKYIGPYRDGFSRAEPFGEIMAMSKKLDVEGGRRKHSKETAGF
jgi:hypothetical protein